MQLLAYTLGGFPIYSCPYIARDYTIIDLPPPTNSFFISLYRKLFWRHIMKRVRLTSQPGYNKVTCIDGKLFAHPSIISELRKALQ